MATVSSSKDLELVQKATETGGKNKSLRVTRDFAHFLIDFNVISTAIAFVIATISVDLCRKLVSTLLISKFRIQNPLLESIVTFFSLIILMYVFVRFVFYNLILTEEVAQENVIKKALDEKKKEVVKDKIEDKPELSREINKEANKIKHVEKVVKEEQQEKRAEKKRKSEEKIRDALDDYYANSW